MKVSHVPVHALAPSRGLCCVRVLFPALCAAEITLQNCPENIPYHVYLLYIDMYIC